jgi:hypothetical protein
LGWWLGWSLADDLRTFSVSHTTRTRRIIHQSYLKKNPVAVDSLPPSHSPLSINHHFSSTMTRNVLILLLSAMVANGFSPAMYQTNTVRAEATTKKRITMS